MLYKNLPAKHLWKVLLVRFFTDYMAAAGMLAAGNRANARAVLEARCAFARQKAEFRKNRKINLQRTKNKNISEIYQKSIVFQYYIKKKKRFSQIGF